MSDPHFEDHPVDPALRARRGYTDRMGNATGWSVAAIVIVLLVGAMLYGYRGHDRLANDGRVPETTGQTTQPAMSAPAPVSPAPAQAPVIR
jgi:hypothetical protein